MGTGSERNYAGRACKALAHANMIEREPFTARKPSRISGIITEGLAPSFEVLCAATVAEGVELLMAAASTWCCLIAYHRAK